MPACKDYVRLNRVANLIEVLDSNIDLHPTLHNLDTATKIEMLRRYNDEHPGEISVENCQLYYLENNIDKLIAKMSRSELKTFKDSIKQLHAALKDICLQLETVKREIADLHQTNRLVDDMSSIRARQLDRMRELCEKVGRELKKRKKS